MADLATLTRPIIETPTSTRLALSRPGSRKGWTVFLAALATGLGYIAVHLFRDLEGIRTGDVWPYFVLGAALLIALAFEFVNGFHDTANAVATVIYTNALEPQVAVVWSGVCNLCGVLLSTGTVAYAIVALLPVDLILQVSSRAGFAMVFALLTAAILWNLGTWWLGLPASSSHTLVGSIIGVGVANQLVHARSGTSGIDWEQARKVLEALLISPLIGFALAGLLLFASKRMLKSAELYRAPANSDPPPLPIRALLVLTCTGVSFYHGSNDGQKGMGLIMLVLIGTVPTAYALNHGIGPTEIQNFIVASQEAGQILDKHIDPAASAVANPRAEVTDFVRTRRLNPTTLPALHSLVDSLGREVSANREYKSIPAADQPNVRNDMYVTSEALRLMKKTDARRFTQTEWKALEIYKAQIDRSIKYIPDWVKVAVALALGLGTMVGWKRIVITVGEKIGKEHLSYAQGASAELVAAATIFAADKFGLPVSTTHILSSGVAGTMAANGSGLRMRTVRNIAAGWVLTMPAAAMLSALLYLAFRQIP